MSRLAGYLLLFLAAFIGVEATSFVGLYGLAKLRSVNYQPGDYLSGKHKKIIKRMLDGQRRANHYTGGYHRFDRILGWVIRENAKFEIITKEGTITYTSNSQGLRASQNYSLRAAANLTRIAAFGDSFTHSDDVNDHETWEAQLERLNPSFQVLNFGVGGYGVDQAFLRYQMQGKSFSPTTVLIGMMAENIQRHVNTFRPFYHKKTNIPLTKPRFAVKDGQLVLLANPISSLDAYERLLSKNSSKELQRIGRYDYYFQNEYSSDWFDFLRSARLVKIFMSLLKHRPRPIYKHGLYFAQSSAFAVTTHLLRAFYEKVKQDGTKPVILIFPALEDLKTLNRGNRPSYEPLLQWLSTRGLVYFDIAEAFTGIRPADLSQLVRGHYTAAGNKLVARYLLKRLKLLGENA
ncbi:MAG: SGNH/GDSL hydrolase family protein [Candidatus Binatia bacterium]